MIQWAVIHSHCAACFGKKKSNIVDFNTWGQCPAWFSERLIGTAPRSLSCCFGALHRAFSLGFALWLVSAETNKHHSSTWRHNNATLYLHMSQPCRQCVCARCVLTCWPARGRWWPPWEPPGTEAPPGGGRGRTAEAWPRPSAATRPRRSGPRLRADNQTVKIFVKWQHGLANANGATQHADSVRLRTAAHLLHVHSSMFWKFWLSSLSPVLLLTFFSTTWPRSWMWCPMAIFSMPLSESLSARRVSLI